MPSAKYLAERTPYSSSIDIKTKCGSRKVTLRIATPRMPPGNKKPAMH